MRDFLQQGMHSSEQPLSQFIRLAAQNMVQQAIAQEVTDTLGRDRYERQAAVNGYRNGYKSGRIRSAEGEIPLAVPQVRGSAEPYQSKLLAFLRGNSDVLEYLVTQMYSRGGSPHAMWRRLSATRTRGRCCCRAPLSASPTVCGRIIRPSASAT
ncbi:MAG: transposase [Aggregatilineales bacterium]